MKLWFRDEVVDEPSQCARDTRDGTYMDQTSVITTKVLPTNLLHSIKESF